MNVFRNMRMWLPGLLASLTLLSACAMASPVKPVSHPAGAAEASGSGVWYEIFVRSWYDTDGDGIGDLNGVTAKLDYLQSLGVDGIWLMPINPSPSYHGYDITNYRAINPQYGTLADFRRLLKEAHKRGIRVIMDMVINHSSSEHPWFKSALKPNSPYRDWYTWAGKYTDVQTPNAFGGKGWHQKDGQYYLSIFDPGMPDLNFDNPAVRQEMIDIGQFWLKLGVDGFRLDAARHIYVNLINNQDSPEAVAKNVAWWEQYRQGLDKVNPHAYLIGEVTQHTAEQLAPYLKALDAVFNFPLSAHLIEAAKSEGNMALAKTLEHVYASYEKVAPGSVQVDAPILSNHDQVRVMTQLDGNLEHMRMAAAMMLTLPGEPYLYYGEELGMTGNKPDPDLRTPMRWQASLHAQGETTWHGTSQHNARLSVAGEQASSHSLLHDYQRLIHWRVAIPALRKGGLKAFPHAEYALAVWQRTLPGKSVLVVHNLSGKAQDLPLDVPDQPNYTRILEHSAEGARIDGRTLRVPAYSTVVLQ